MTHPEYFGNPENPFEETFESPEDIFWGSPIRRVAKQQILYLIGFQGEVKRSVGPGGELMRSVQINARAPLHQEGVFLNSSRTDFDEEQGQTFREPITLTLQDLSRNSGVIDERRITLKRSNGEPFGVAGFNHEQKTIRDILAVSTRLTNFDGPYAEVWGHFAEEKRLLACGAPPITGSIDSHLIALSRTIGRKLAAASLKPGEEPKTTFADF